VHDQAGPATNRISCVLSTRLTTLRGELLPIPPTVAPVEVTGLLQGTIVSRGGTADFEANQTLTPALYADSKLPSAASQLHPASPPFLPPSHEARLEQPLIL
jgi:hypothetical protein